MRVNLENFKQHESLDLELPDQGLVLFKGVSGSGKTSVVDAIYDAMWGGAYAKPWGGGRTVQEIQFNLPESIRIVKTHTPDTLMVETARGTFRDAAAETEIARVFGMGAQEFLASSYIRQRMEGSLLKLGPAEQLRFVQRLAFKDQDPEVQRKRIAKFVTKYETEFGTEQTILASLTEMRESRQKSLDEAALKLVNPDVKHSSNYSKEVEAYRLGEKHRDSVSDRIRELTREYNNPLYLQLSQLEGARTQLVGDVAALQDALTAAHAEVAALPAPYAEMSREACAARGAAIEKKRKFLKSKEKVGILVARLQERWPEAKGKPASAFLNEAQVATADRLSAAMTRAVEQRELQRSLEESLKAKPCPACQVPLMLKDGVLHIHGSAQSMDEIKTGAAAAAAAFKQATDDATAARLDGTAINSMLAEVNALKAELGTDPDPTMDVAVEDAKLANYIGEQERLVLAAKMGADTVARLSRQLQQAKINVTAKEAEIAAASKLRARDQVGGELATADAAYEKAKAHLAELEPFLAKRREFERDTAAYCTAFGMIQKMREELASLDAKVVEQQAKVTAAGAKLGARKRLQELSDFAAVTAINGYLDDMNDEAKPFIDRLFPDTGTTMRILNTSKTAKDEERAKFSLEIFHRGHYVGKKLDPLSGGEQDRCVLAYQLSLSEIYNSPILFVDEGFAGADVEKTMLIGLEVLKEVSAKKLIIVVQHGVPESFFDQIVNF